MTTSLDIFTRLAPTRFPELRPLQRLALEALDGTNETDVAIEMPTGSGKTLIGALAAAKVMEVGESVVYLAYTRQLVAQVRAECQALGLMTEVMEAPLRDVPIGAIRRVNFGQAVGIMTYAGYFSEREVVDPPRLLIFDDAHLAESALLGRFAVTVDARRHARLFRDLLDLIAADAPGYPVVDDIVSNAREPSTQGQLLAFPHVTQIADRARQLLDAAVGGVEELYFPYMRIKDSMARCLWLVSPQGLQIRPLRFPLTPDTRFRDTRRRLYLSATLGDLSDLRRRLGTPAMYRLPLPEIEAQEVPGHRFIVAYDVEPDSEARDATRQQMAAATPRRVWFCRSRDQATRIQAELLGQGRRAYLLEGEGEIVETFVHADQADLVIAGRYDGMDFADDRSRLAVFPTVPYDTDPLDEFMSANFPGTSFLHGRIALRLTQALGRLTRGDDDWAVVVLEDPRIAHQLSRREVAAHLPPRLFSEVQNGLTRSEKGMDQSAGLAVRVLTGEVHLPVEGEWRRPPQQNREWPVAWSGWEADFGDRLFSATFDGAIPAAARLLAGLGDHTLRAWWLYLKAWAEFASGVQDTRIDRFEAAATDLEAAVRAAGHTSWFARVEASLAVVRRRLPARPEAAEDDPPIARFATAFRSSARREAWMASVSAGLATDEHDPFAEAWTRVGQALGYVAEQPEGAAATDSRWRGVEGAFVFEAKIDHQPGSVISRRDVNQLLGQIEEERLASSEVFGAFITVLDRCHQDVGPLANQVTLVSVDAARRVWERTQHLMAMAVDLSMAGHSMADVRPPEGWLRRLVASGRGHLVVPADVDTVWPARVP